MSELKSDIEVFNSECESLNNEINAAHHAHYQLSPTGLIKPEEQPNGNIIHSLFTDGGITYEKGGCAYGRRSSFDKEYNICNSKLLKLKFPNAANYGLSFAILTEEECYRFRNKIQELVSKLPKELIEVR